MKGLAQRVTCTYIPDNVADRKDIRSTAFDVIVPNAPIMYLMP